MKKKYSWEKYVSPELRWKFTDDLELKIVMEYQKIINLLDGTTNQPPKFRTRTGAEIHDEKWASYNNYNVKFKTSMIRSNLCHYSDAYIHVKGPITVPHTTSAAAPVNNTNKKSNI